MDKNIGIINKIIEHIENVLNTQNRFGKNINDIKKLMIPANRGSAHSLGYLLTPPFSLLTAHCSLFTVHCPVLIILNPVLLFADAGPIPEPLLTPTASDGEE